MKFFDTHAHIGLIHNDPIEELIVIQQAKQAGVEQHLPRCGNLPIRGCTPGTELGKQDNRERKAGESCGYRRDRPRLL